MKPQPKAPQSPSEVARRAEHGTSKEQQRRAGERLERADGIKPHLEQEPTDRTSPTSRERSR